MSEERTQYTVEGLQIENELLRERNEALRKTLDGFTDASNFQWAEYQRRIKELEATVARLEQDNKRHLDAMRRYYRGTVYTPAAAQRYDLAATITAQARRIKELEAKVARLEADNRRLRHLDAMPVDAMRRYVNYAEQDAGAFDAAQYIDDRNEIRAWLDGDA